MKKAKVLLTHNEITPYRLSLFEELSKRFDLKVYFCKSKSIYRSFVRKSQHKMCEPSLKKYSFKHEILPYFELMNIFVINYTLPLKLIFNKFDIYIINEYTDDIFSVLVTLFFAKLYGKPAILWLGNIDIEYKEEQIGIQKTKKRFAYKILNIYRNAVYSLCDYFIAYCDKTKRYLTKRGVDEDKIFTGGQVMPLELLPAADFDKSDKKYHDKIVILTVSYLLKRKGIEYLIEAYKKLNTSNTVLLIAGSGPNEAYLRSLSNGRKDIHFLGYVNAEEKARLYAIADIFVLPTLLDPWGLVINEAMYYGCPVITTTNAGATDIIKEGKNGFIVKPGNVTDLKEKLNILVNDDDLRKNLVRQAKEDGEKACDVELGIEPFLRAVKRAITHR